MQKSSSLPAPSLTGSDAGAEKLLCTVTMLKASRDETLDFVNYHRRCGVDHLYLYFDDPEDAAIEALRDLDFVTCVPCDPHYWSRCSMVRNELSLPQAEWRNLDHALRCARRDGFQWLIHVDCDERLYSRQSIRDLLTDVETDVDVVRFRTLEAVPEALSYERPFEQIRLFRVGPCRPTRRDLPLGWWKVGKRSVDVANYYTRLVCAFLLGCKTLRQGPYLRGHVGGKAAVRVNAEFAGMGVHLPRPVEGKRLSSIFHRDAVLLHFDSVDYAAWKRKWEGRSQESKEATTRKRSRKQQVRDYVSVSRRGNEEDLQQLFRRQYFLTPYEQVILRKLGLLVELEPGVSGK